MLLVIEHNSKVTSLSGADDDGMPSTSANPFGARSGVSTPTLYDHIPLMSKTASRRKNKMAGKPLKPQVQVGFFVEQFNIC